MVDWVNCQKRARLGKCTRRDKTDEKAVGSAGSSAVLGGHGVAQKVAYTSDSVMRDQVCCLLGVASDGGSKIIG